MSSGRGRSGFAGGSGRGRAGGGASEDFTPIPKERRGQTVRRIAAFFRPYRARVVVVMVSIVFTSFLGIINPYLLKFLLDTAIPDQDFRQLNIAVALMIILPIISGLIGVGQAYLNNIVGQHVMQDLRDALYAHWRNFHLLGDSCGRPELPRRDTDESLEVAGENWLWSQKPHTGRPPPGTRPSLRAGAAWPARRDAG